jgi:phospho-N-acetylmuramoyl-pentapeptide-transferase
VGLIDDVIKGVLKRPLGLKARHKLTGQVIISLTLALFVLNNPEFGGHLVIPFTANYLELPAWALAFLIVATLIGTSNAVNITDGLDGLAAGTTAITSLVLAAVMLSFGKPELAIFAGALGGACIGFMWFNSYPAQVIMGDVGALGIGAGLATIAVLGQAELYLLLAGGLFVLESLSVMAQVTYFRITKGKRIFKMTPIHYHFQKSGWVETSIVARFILVAFLFGIVTLLALPR